MGVFDSYITVGEEAVAYGTLAASLTRGYEALVDPGKVTMQRMVSNGMRADFATTKVGRSRLVQMGGEGSLEVDLLSNSMGLLFKAAIGTQSTITGPPAGYRYVGSASEPGTSLTVQMARGRATTAGALAKNYLGGKVKSWEIMQSVASEDSWARLKLAMDYRSVTSGAALATAAYPADAFGFSWRECTITVDGDDTCSWDLSITGDNGLKTDSFCLDGAGNKHEPYRVTAAQWGGKFTSDYDDDTLYDLSQSGATVPIVVSWVGQDADHSLTITMPECEFELDGPTSQPGQSQQTATWRCLDNDVDAPIEFEYITDDVAP
jgi:hypothetical protein